MQCPFCGNLETKVADSRWIKTENTIKRRRKCDNCHKRFSTIEATLFNLPIIIKNDGRRESYERLKITSGIIKASQKRAISMSQINVIVGEIEKSLAEFNQREIPSRIIGDMVMGKLKRLDAVAYVRFAAVYKTFQDIEEFISDLKNMGQNYNEDRICTEDTRTEPVL